MGSLLGVEEDGDPVDEGVPADALGGRLDERQPPTLRAGDGAGHEHAEVPGGVFLELEVPEADSGVYNADLTNGRGQAK